MDRLAGERALVVGASRGIGRAIAEAYDAEGASVALAARSVDTLERLADDMEDAVAVACDVRDSDQVDDAVDCAADAFGGLDIVVNNAGIMLRREIAETSDEEMDRILDVNLKGQMRVARAAIPALVESEGALVNVSSQLGEVGVENASVYCASKGGINNLTRQLALQHAEDGVRVNALAPGIVETSMNADLRADDSEWVAEKRRSIPLDRLGTPDEIAGPAVFLASDEASYVTGHVLVVDGGYVSE